MPKDHPVAVTGKTLLEFYQNGLFPMADGPDEHGFYLMNPEERTVFDPANFHIPKSLQKFIRKTDWRVTINTRFKAVVDLCRAPRVGRMTTWINHDIRDLFVELHAMGHAHSIEVWNANNRLIGGLYGLALGRVFCAESMVSLESNASSVALAALMRHLKQCGFTLCDVQYSNPHLEKFKPKTIARDQYLNILTESIKTPALFTQNF